MIKIIARIRMERPLIVENPTKESPRYTILVVDDEESIRRLIVTFLSQQGHECVTAIDGVDALYKVKGNKIDAVVTDVKMPNMDGITLTSKILKQYPELPIMVMTGFDEEYSAGIAISVGAREFIKKPFSPDEFIIRLKKMINDSEILRRMKSEKNVAENMYDIGNGLEEMIEKMINDSESVRPVKSEENVDENIQESMNEVETLRRTKGEKDVDEDMGELRHHPRYLVKLPIDFWQTPDVVHGGVVTDMSEAGLGIWSIYRIEIGAELGMRVYLLGGELNFESIEGTGKIIWRIAHQEGYRYGLYILKMASDSLDRLMKHILKLQEEESSSNGNGPSDGL